MIQDISPNIYDNTYKIIAPDAGSYLIFIGEREILAKASETVLSLPRYSEEYAKGLTTVYLFSVGAKKFFYATGTTAEKALKADGFSYIPLHRIQWLEPRQLTFGAETAYQLCNWYRANKFCGRCGEPTRRDENERMLRCDKCKNEIYPKICPAVIVGVINGDKILLTKYAGRSFSRFALIAGFAEVGESIEQTVHREVMEETGVKVKNLHFYKSQPWSFSDTLLMGFFCELDGSDKIKIEEAELSLAQWATADEIPDDSERVSLTYEMMSKFKAHGTEVLYK